LRQIKEVDASHRRHLTALSGELRSSA
jgi:hypothetical protein